MGETQRRGWVDLPSLSAFAPALLSNIDGRKCSSLTAPHKGPTTALHCPGGTRMPLSPQGGHKPSQRGRHGHPGFRAAPGQDDWQRNSVRKPTIQFFSPKLFRENRSRQETPPIVLCGVIFSRSRFPKSNFFKIFRSRRRFSFFVVIRLIDSFPPHFLEGTPSTRWRAAVVCNGIFLSQSLSMAFAQGKIKSKKFFAPPAHFAHFSVIHSERRKEGSHGHRH